ncbi:MAG: hypothetical protein RLN62_07195 [Rickettsiales bacterium]
MLEKILARLSERKLRRFRKEIEAESFSQSNGKENHLKTETKDLIIKTLSYKERNN